MRSVLFAIALLYSVGVGAMPQDIKPLKCESKVLDCANAAACKAMTTPIGSFPCDAGWSQNDAPCTPGSSSVKTMKMLN
ncbi:hypothetical protein BUE80_DR006402 [Diplocarpon rosae]|nr:hypothetical protein BUE80_DR006402 [Diplocarpon rosae]